MEHLRYAGAPPDRQRAVFLEIICSDPLVREALLGARDLDLPDWWIVSGALYNTVWNHLTGRPSGYGVKDVDLFISMMAIFHGRRRTGLSGVGKTFSAACQAGRNPQPGARPSLV